MAGLYIHIPFCERKCRYCDFYSTAELADREIFTESIIKEAELRLRAAGSAFSFDTVFIGGGTPSLLSVSQISRIIDAVRRHANIVDSAEFTIESNPGSLSRQLLKEYRNLGINRLSIGVQSFSDADLAFLGRVHDSQQALAAIREAQEAGFENLNLDLIFEIPGQSIDTWKENLRIAARIGVPHISAYSLIFEESTPLYNDWLAGRAAKASEDTAAEQYILTEEILQSAGFGHYEISNFARPGFECKHNLNYWNHGEYIALGPSAHGFASVARYWNCRDLHRYISMLTEGQLPTEGSETIGREEAIEEEIYLSLRSTGLDWGRFTQQYGIDESDSIADMFNNWQKNGLATLEGGKVRLSGKGYCIADRLALDLIRLVLK